MNQALVLVIDDDIGVGEGLAENLSFHGHPARWMPSLNDALVEKLSPSVVVLDLNMPGCDGFTAIDRLAELAHRPSLVIASGQGGRVISAAAASARASGLNVLGALEKPFAIPELIRLVELGKAAARGPSPMSPALDADLLWAQEHGFDLVYQPKVHTQTLRLVGHEALLRPRAAGLTAEAMFSPAAPPDFQRAMTLAVVRKALRDSGTPRIGAPRLPVAINCPPDVLALEATPEDLLRALREAGACPGCLHIELTEQESLQPDHLITRALARLKMAGVKVVLDDFGKGSTSLERIIRYPIDEVKIDKELFWAGVEDAHTLQIVRDIVAFCRSKRIATTFEGIETERHLRIARECMPDYCQGYLLGSPGALATPGLVAGCAA